MCIIDLVIASATCPMVLNSSRLLLLGSHQRPLTWHFATYENRSRHELIPEDQWIQSCKSRSAEYFKTRQVDEAPDDADTDHDDDDMF